MLADRRLGPVVNPGEQVISFEQWLESYIGKDKAENGELAIIDLSLVPSDVLHIVIAVVARIVFEATQRYRKLNDEELPTVLVLEEAHIFVKKASDEESDTPAPSQMCRQTFERIAREGRKFGLGLVLASQRPSELSPTVLAQCNIFLLHRIVNDRDQELVGKLVPDNLGGLLKELPSLPSRQAILLGWAATVPTLVEITELPEDHRPRSSDPEFWNVWTGKKERPINWREIADDWTGIHTQSATPSRSSSEEEEP
jgi:DNA helicase HerA-like ATPase